MKISKLYLYDEPSVPEINVKQIADFINKNTNINVEIRTNFLNHFDVDERVLRDIASCRIFNLYSTFEKHTPTKDEIFFERNIDAGDSVNIVLYDGFELQHVFNKIIPDDEVSEDVFHLIFTARMVCTYDYNDYRYHGRAIICSNPSIISTTGLIEAPAKPKEYYLRLYEKYHQGLNMDAIKNEFKGRFLEHHDSRMNKVVIGYTLQAIFYYLIGSPFCESRDCMLYNAHWQEDLLHAQIDSGILCNKHQIFFNKLKKYE